MKFEQNCRSAACEVRPTGIRERIAQYTDRQLASQAVPEAFSPLAYAPLPEADSCRARQDFRAYNCLTIDCDHTKDMDDAVSLERLDDGWLLGVYIADVASYVMPGSPLDQEATARGTSIYLPDRTIPMLPPVLSNDLCSLNPNVDRRAVAVMIRLDRDANVTGCEISKALIRSRVKGVYSEVARILDGIAGPALAAKYASVLPSLREMHALAQVLRTRRVGRGQARPSSDGPEIVLTDSGVELRPRKRNAAEDIIEEFMVLANSQVADYMAAHNLPTLYRAQTEKQTMAFYTPDVSRHAELGLERYVHFTSPIRRLADLKIHQVLSEHLDGTGDTLLSKRYGGMMQEASELAVKRSRRADGIQKACAQFCYREYFLHHAPAVYTGCVTGYDRSRRPVIQIDQIQVNVGAAAVRASVGQRVCMMVSVDNQDKLVAYHITPDAA